MRKAFSVSIFCAITGASVIYFHSPAIGADAQRAARIQEFLADVCRTSAINIGKDMDQLLKIANDCEYGDRSRAADLASQTNSQLIDALVAQCVRRGGVSNTEHIGQKMAALDGRVVTDADSCRGKVQKAFPEF